jgi:hypothetical protein
MTNINKHMICILGDGGKGGVPITTKVVSSNPAGGKMNSIQHYVIKFVSDLQVSKFLS